MEVIVKGQPSIEIGFETKVIQVGGLGDIDSSLSTESENPVQNKVITAEFESVHTELDSQNELIEDLQNTKIDKEADDYYPQLAVGLADNLAGVDVVDSEINFRRSGGGAISDGVARIESIKGNSVVWNQRFAPRNYTINGITTTYQDGKYHSVGQLTSTFFNVNQFDANELNHKYLFIAAGFSSSFSGKFGLLNRNAQETITNGFAYILHDNTTPTLNRYIGFVLLTEGDEIDETYTLVQYDLTQMFGAGNEPTTIEEFYARKPMGIEDENVYNEGEVIHMDVQSIESQGVNAWDEEWEVGWWNIDTLQWEKDSRYLKSKNFISILPNTQYRITNPSGTISRYVYYDKDKQYISYVSANSNSIFTTPSNACYMMFGLGSAYKLPYNHDICINISDTSINGKYFPYVKRVEDLGIIRNYFPQGMKSAGTAHDEIRYNKATQKWEMVQRIGEVDMGTLAWGYNNSVGNERLFTLSLTDVMQVPNTETKGGLLTTLYSAASFNNIYSHSSDKLIGLHTNGQLVVYDSAYTNATSFKDAMQGVILYYELAEPIVTELDAEDQFRDLDYQVWNCGTEKAIAEGKSAPLAADITYGFNAIGKIKELESLVAALRAKVGI